MGTVVGYSASRPSHCICTYGGHQRTPRHIIILPSGCMGDTQFHFRVRCSGAGAGGTDLKVTSDHATAPLVLTVREDRQNSHSFTDCPSMIVSLATPFFFIWAGGQMKKKNKGLASKTTSMIHRAV